MFKTILAAGFVTIAASGGAQESNPAPPIILHAASSNLLAMPTFGSFGNAQCDSKGNLYFHAARTINDSLILRLSQDGSHDIFALSSQDAADVYFVAFRVASDGRLWILNQGQAGEIYVFDFSRDSQTPNRTLLQAPKDLKPRNFAVLKNGHTLLQGFFDESVAPERRGRSYFAHFDLSGRLVRQALDEASGDELKELAKVAAQGAAAIADDGSVYILDQKTLLVVSQTGEITQKIKLHYPEEGYVSRNLFVSENRIVVTYSKMVEMGRPLLNIYQLLDRSTGEQLGQYRPDDELGNRMVCFSRDGFTFIGVSSGRIKLMTAKP